MLAALPTNARQPPVYQLKKHPNKTPWLPRIQHVQGMRTLGLRRRMNCQDERLRLVQREPHAQISLIVCPVIMD
jgi:hypothetical protein